MATKRSKRKGVSGGIIFTPAEENAVKAINKVGKASDAANRVIGKAVAKLIEERGGTAYGEDTLGRLARHPSLLFSVEHLRRCWQYHQLLGQYGKALKKAGRQKLTYSHHYQLSRLLDIEDKAAQQEAVMAMADKSINEKLTVSDLQKAVSTHLASLRKAISGKNTDANVDTPTTPAPEQDGYEVLIDTSKTMVTATEKVLDAPTLSRLAELNLVANRLGFAYAQLVTKLVTAGFDDTVDAAKKIISVIESAIGIKIANGGTSHVN